MYNSLKTRNLFIIFGVLLVLVLLTALPGNQKKNRSFNSELSQFDPAEVSQFYLYPRGGGERISFRKSGEQWMVANTSGEYNADRNQVDRMLGSISALKALRLAAREKDAWDKYEVTDSLGTRVEVLQEGKILADIILGRFSYAQPAGPANPYQNQQGSMTTYVRLNKEKEVYAVDGFLAMSFNGQLKNFRDPVVLKLSENDVSQFSMSGDGQEYRLVKQDSLWLLNGVVADSAGMADYLSALRSLRSTNYLPPTLQPVGNPTHSLQVEGINGEMLARIDAYVTDSMQIAISSSLNPGSWFDGLKDDLFEKLFGLYSSM